MTRPRFSTLFALGVAVTAIVLLAAAVLLGRTSEPAGRTVLTVRLWDQQVATAYRQSFDAFTAANPGHRGPHRHRLVRHLLRHAAHRCRRRQRRRRLLDQQRQLRGLRRQRPADGTIEPSADWVPSVVDQFTRNGTLWGVPQLSDAGIAVYYNADLLARPGLTPDALTDLRWSPDPAIDTLRPLAARLTVDADGNHADTPGFDPRRIRQWGYNAANDFQGIYLNYIGSAGGMFHDGDKFAFDNPQAAQAFDYLVALINDDHVAPPAADTNDNGDFSRNQFLAGRMALFQSGTYNLAPSPRRPRSAGASRMLPDGPGGPGQRHQRHCRGGQFGHQASRRGAQAAGLDGQRRGQRLSRRRRRGHPRGDQRPSRCTATTGATRAWTSARSSMCSTARASPRPAARASPPASTAFKPYFDEMFLGRLPVNSALAQAQSAANTAARR